MMEPVTNENQITKEVVKIIQLSNVGLSFNGHQILKGLHFSVQLGEFFVIIGPNGSGKTSLVRLLAGLLAPTVGTIRIFEKNPFTWNRKKFSRQVAVLAQQIPTEFPFRVAETVLMGRAPHLRLWELEKTHDYRLAYEAMAFTGIAHLANRYLDEISGGERQRVFIAQALCRKPNLLLLDEPTAALDPAHQIMILDLLERMRREQGITVVMVSHDLNLASMYADRLLLLDQGKIAGLGPPVIVLKRARLEKCYRCSLLVDENPLGNVPRVIPIPQKHRPD